MRALNLSDLDVLKLVEIMDILGEYSHYPILFTSEFVHELRSLELKIKEERIKKQEDEKEPFSTDCGNWRNILWGLQRNKKEIEKEKKEQEDDYGYSGN